MQAIGIVVEYNPFHNGHLYQINKIKELYPSSIIVLILNGYFLERGLISLESKEEKTRLALKYGADLVIELPFVFGSNSADIFAESSIELLNALNINYICFGSESNDIDKLYKIANRELESDFDSKVKEYLDQGINYPTALNKAVGVQLNDPNDLLGVSYIKSILKNKYNIKPILIKRTNNYHDNNLDNEIVSASNIRTKLDNNEDITKYIPEGNIENIDYNLFFNLLKYKIITEDNLDKYLTVDEGIDNKLKKVIMNCNNLNELIDKIKTKRYTYNRIMRMFIHILMGLTKEDKLKITNNEYIRLLGFTKNGQEYINKNKEIFTLPLITKITNSESLIWHYEQKAAKLYSLLTSDKEILKFEYNNRPLKNV